MRKRLERKARIEDLLMSRFVNDNQPMTASSLKAEVLNLEPFHRMRVGVGGSTCIRNRNMSKAGFRNIRSRCEKGSELFFMELPATDQNASYIKIATGLSKLVLQYNTPCFPLLYMTMLADNEIFIMREKTSKPIGFYAASKKFIALTELRTLLFKIYFSIYAVHHIYGIALGDIPLESIYMLYDKTRCGKEYDSFELNVSNGKREIFYLCSAVTPLLCDFDNLRLLSNQRDANNNQSPKLDYIAVTRQLMQLFSYSKENKEEIGRMIMLTEGLVSANNIGEFLRGAFADLMFLPEGCKVVDRYKIP